MNDSNNSLRRRAEATLDTSSSASVEPRTDEILRLIHELNVHHVELEMQNDELRRTQRKLMESTDRFTELFELAPVAYLTVNSDGHITEANTRTSELFERESNRIVGSPLLSTFL